MTMCQTENHNLKVDTTDVRLAGFQLTTTGDVTGDW